MTEPPKPLKEQFLERLEASLKARPERDLADWQKQIQAELRGACVSMNLALGNTRDAVAGLNELGEAVVLLGERITVVEERLDRMAEWAKTKAVTK